MLHLVPRTRTSPHAQIVSVCMHGFVQQSRCLMLRSAGYSVEEAHDAIVAAPIVRKGLCDVVVLGQLLPIQHKRVLAAAAMAKGIFVVTICEDCDIERNIVRADVYLDPLRPTDLLKVLKEAGRVPKAA